MAFESLSERLQESLKKVTGQSTLTEQNMDEMFREIRLALLEADVNFKVVKDFINTFKILCLYIKNTILILCIFILYYALFYAYLFSYKTKKE